jgi:hypothetical protein
MGRIHLFNEFLPVWYSLAPWILIPPDAFALPLLYTRIQLNPGTGLSQIAFVIEADDSQHHEHGWAAARNAKRASLL